MIDIAADVRKRVIKMYYRAGWGHLAPSLSCAEIITALMFGGFIGSDKYDVHRLILSKGHGAASLYAAMEIKGLLSHEEIKGFYQNGSNIGALSGNTIEGITIPTGSLGHGICYATGLAEARKNAEERNVYVVLGDGEMQEGSVWEAASFASQRGLDNLIVILDRNGLQASDHIKNIVGEVCIDDRWKSFGWDVAHCDGHDCDEICKAVNEARKEHNKPTIIIAKTIKGRGLLEGENNPSWHSRTPQKREEWEKICNNVGLTMEELEKE